MSGFKRKILGWHDPLLNRSRYCMTLNKLFDLKAGVYIYLYNVLHYTWYIIYKLKYTPAVRSNILSKLIFASCV